MPNKAHPAEVPDLPDWLQPYTGDPDYESFFKSDMHEGGSGSGDFEHPGRPGERGGSMATGPHREPQNEAESQLLKAVHFMNDQYVKHGQPNPKLQRLVDEGKFYTPQELPSDYKRMTARECYGNATKIALEYGTNNPKATYVEGMAANGLMPLGTGHAWNTNGDGKAIDATWEKPIDIDPLSSRAYYGIEIDDSTLRKQCMSAGKYGPWWT